MSSLRKIVPAIGALLAIGLASPAAAEHRPSTRLVSCGPESCLLVTGHRDDAAAEVRINGHQVDVRGGRNWRAKLPVATVREWSLPFARRIEVSVHDEKAGETSSRHAVLPIGLLGHVPDLASLVITLR